MIEDKMELFFKNQVIKKKTGKEKKEGTWKDRTDTKHIIRS